MLTPRFGGEVRGKANGIALQVPTRHFVADEHQNNQEADTVASNASCNIHSRASVCKVLDDTISVMCGMVTTMHRYNGDQVASDGRQRDFRRACASA